MEITNLTMGELAGNMTLAVIALSAFIEITPIKINPLSELLQWIGSKMNKRLIERIEEQDRKIDSLAKAIDENEIDRIRYEILRFSNSCRNGQKHTEDEFDHIIELADKYHVIIARNNLTNGKIDLEYDFIIEIYHDCQKHNSFL